MYPGIKKDNFNYRSIGTFDVAEIKQKLLDEPPENWNLYDFRQNTFDTHKNTQTIPLVWLSNSWKPGSKEPAILQLFHEFKHYMPFMDALYNDVLSITYPRCYIVKAMFANLFSHSNIATHTDNGDALQKVHRCHLVIQTNHDVVFFINGIAHHFTEGRIIEINNMRPHSVENRGDTNRFHLIIDLLEEVYFPHGINYNLIDSKHMNEFVM